MIEHEIGMTMSATTKPAMNVEAVYTLCGASGSVGSAPSTLNNGIHDTHVESQRASPIT
jgi:hypothetical protein